MPISSNTRKAGPFTGTGLVTTYPFNFKVFQAADVYVVRADLTGTESVLVLNTDYTVSLNADQDVSPGGNVVLSSALTSGYTLVITSNIENLQPTDLTNGGGFYPSVITDALDRACIQIQQLQEVSGRSVKVDITSSTDPANYLAEAKAARDAAQAAQAGSEAALDEFTDLYLGVKSSDPTTDNDGNALQEGALYWNSSAHRMMVYETGAWSDVTISASFIVDVFSGTLTNLSYPSSDGSYRDLARSGWLHAGLNQQWGGGQWGAELVDGATGQMYKFDVATGQIEDNSAAPIGATANPFGGTQGFKVSEAINNPSIWLKLAKAGNPTDNIAVYIMSDNGSGVPLNVIGTGSSISSKQITSKLDGEWYKFTTGSVSLVAGTQYHILVTRTGAIDASNYYLCKVTSTGKYPFDLYYYSNNVDPPSSTYTQVVGYARCFLIENPSSTRLLQSGGQFDQKLVFGADTYPSQIKALWQPLKNFFDSKEFTFPFRGTGTKGKPLADFLYGLDHDRVLLSCNTSTGYAQVDVWDSAGTKRTVTGTTDVSTGFHDVAVHVRAKGDGADKIELFVDGVSQGTPLTGLTLTFDPLMRDLGNGFIGAGMPTAPTWTHKADMSVLPSAQGYTWAGTGVEANCMSVSGGKLYQNKNGYGSTDTGWYQKTTTFNNATGWTVSWKGRVPSNTNTPNSFNMFVSVNDGAKVVWVFVNEYFIQTQSATTGTTVQGDFKAQERVFTLCGKGSDYYFFVDGKLVVDGTGLLTVSSATNSVNFGNASSTSGEKADAIWDYVAYYTGGMLIPQAGGVCNELAYFSGDKTSYLPALYNAGTPISIKQFTGQSRNYVGEGVVQKEVRRGVTSGPTTTSTTPVLLTDMECYVVGKNINQDAYAYQLNSTTGYDQNYCYLDGIQDNNSYLQMYGTTPVSVAAKSVRDVSFGLHKCDSRWFVNTGTGTTGGTSRQLIVEARS